MRGIFWVLMLSAVITGLASADPYDVRNGVAIAHAPSGLAFTTDPPTDYCEHYDTIAITSCEQQVNTITDPELQAVWYVLLAWSEPKYWAAFEFGLSDYDPDAYVITEHSICNPPGGALSITTDVPDPVWPDPGSGIALAATERTEIGAWSGNFVPVYWFAGYAYGATVVSLVDMPLSGFMSLVPLPDHVGYEQAIWDPEVAGGAMGMNMAGKAVCPGAGEATGACCNDFGSTCTVLTQADCTTQGGTFMGADTVCDPSPCTVESACCVGTSCFMLSDTACTDSGGLSFPGEACLEDGGTRNCALFACCIDDDCFMFTEADCVTAGGTPTPGALCLGEPGGTVDCTTPADEHSWGSVKAAYR